MRMKSREGVVWGAVFSAVFLLAPFTVKAETVGRLEKQSEALSKAIEWHESAIQALKKDSKAVPSQLPALPPAPEDSNPSCPVPESLRHGFVTRRNSIFLRYDVTKCCWKSAPGAVVGGGDQSGFAKDMTLLLRADGRIPRSYEAVVSRNGSLQIVPANSWTRAEALRWEIGHEYARLTTLRKLLENQIATVREKG